MMAYQSGMQVFLINLKHKSNIHKESLLQSRKKEWASHLLIPKYQSPNHTYNIHPKKLRKSSIYLQREKKFLGTRSQNPKKLHKPRQLGPRQKAIKIKMKRIHQYSPIQPKPTLSLEILRWSTLLKTQEQRIQRPKINSKKRTLSLIILKSSFLKNSTKRMM